MNNQEALILGVQSWLDANKDLIIKSVHEAARKSIDNISEIVGVQIAARCRRFLEENKQDFTSAIALQFAINKIENSPRMREMAAEGIGLQNQDPTQPEKPVEGESK